jgi:hypothetical protein
MYRWLYLQKILSFSLAYTINSDELRHSFIHQTCFHTYKQIPFMGEKLKTIYYVQIVIIWVVTSKLLKGH